MIYTNFIEMMEIFRTNIQELKKDSTEDEIIQFVCTLLPHTKFYKDSSYNPDQLNLAIRNTIRKWLDT